MPAATSRRKREGPRSMMASARLHPGRVLAMLLLISATALAAIAPGIRAAESGNPQVDQAVTWLATQQIDNGGFAAFGGESDAGTTADVVFALVAAGVDPATVESAAGNSPLDYLSGVAADASDNPGLAGKIVLAMIAAGRDPRDVGGLDLVAAIERGVDPETGLYGFGAVNHSFALLALAASGADVEPDAIEALENIQIEDGSWSFTGDTAPGSGDTNTTAVAVQAMVATGGSSDAIANAIDYILSAQDESGAIAYDFSEAPDLVGDANSTSVAVQALLAADVDASLQVEVLSTFQSASGAFFWRADFSDDSLLATAQVIPALMKAPLPIDPLLPGPVEPVDPGAGSALEQALQPAEPIAGCTYFEVTSHNACGSFAEFWTVNGGLAIFGYPLTEEFTDEHGRTVQFFERGRFELHPENAGTPYEVLLGRLGAEQIEHATRP
jgi:hypothetical protein